MIRQWQMLRHVLLLSCLAGMTALAACTPDISGEGADQGKVGMHIDATLEFAVEYPLSWEKTRLVDRGSDRGQVVWRLEPATVVDQTPVLTITSEPSLSRETDRFEDRLEDFHRRHPGFEVTSRKEFEMNDGPALRITGFTSRNTYELYLLTAEARLFTLVFAAPPEVFGRLEKTIAEIVVSFILLDRSDETARPD